LKTTRLRHSLTAGTLAMLACAVLPPAVAEDGKAILNAKCMACHTPEGNDALSRISYQHKGQP
jgi:quinohemoprotein amine dehydrogenase